MSGSEAMAALADAWPEDGIAVLESPVEYARAAQPAAAVDSPAATTSAPPAGSASGSRRRSGCSSRSRTRPVVCVLGEGSAQYGITALWTAVAYRAPVTFLVLRNEEYMILKWFAALEQVEGAPGLDLPGLDTAAVARAYGMPARDVADREELTSALREAIAAGDGPRLVQVRVASGMWME